MRPLWMVYENDDDMGAPATLIFKNGDGRFLHFYLFEKQLLHLLLTNDGYKFQIFVKTCSPYKYSESWILYGKERGLI